MCVILSEGLLLPWRSIIGRGLSRPQVSKGLAFERLKGHLALGYEKAMEDLLDKHGILVEHLKAFVLQQADRLKAHVHAVADKADRPWQYFTSAVRKDQRSARISGRRGSRRAMGSPRGSSASSPPFEPCRTFGLAYGRGRATVHPAWRRCLFL